MIGIPEVYGLASIALIGGCLWGLFCFAEWVARRWHGRRHTTRENVRHYIRADMNRGWDGPTSYDPETRSYRQWGNR